MTGKTFHMIVEKDEDGWFVGSVVELPGCHTQARSLEDLRTRTREAIECYVESKWATPEGLAIVAIETLEV